MINGKSVLAVITARGGSKRLPGKNTLPLAGKPMIVWTIDAAFNSRYIDKTIISTDDKNIANLGRLKNCDIPFLRPKKLATDIANSDESVLHAIKNLKEIFDIVIKLQPTSPLRKSEDIDNALELVNNNNYPAIISVCELKKPIYWYLNLEQDGRIKPMYNNIMDERSSLKTKKTYIPNGALFIAKTNFFTREKTFYTESTFSYKMPPERSIDIDDLFDFKIAELFIKDP